MAHAPMLRMRKATVAVVTGHARKQVSSRHG
jgi:hypothetical protein